MVVVASIYKFVPLKNYGDVASALEGIARSLDIKGTLILASEGINGTVAGTRSSIDELAIYLDSMECFQKLEYKESFCETMPFYRLKILTKKEIVTFGIPLDPLTVVGDYVEPQSWNQLISRSDVITLDTRNDYEVRIGTFKGSINPNTKNFREFSNYVTRHLDPKEHKNIAMFCTGGVRCEKSTSYLKILGFENVYHLRGGILKYLAEIPEERSLWEGECFVFDQRISLKHGLYPGTFTMCRGCREPLSPRDRRSPFFQEGVCCPHCHESLTENRRWRLLEREKQISLARKRGDYHLGKCYPTKDPSLMGDSLQEAI